ncbi:hypothetical protein RKLH11_257 [Rhodobacteraceae bacterium KLH11]|nr:hypothetical protein RKLH11_257 [Rhodobacteraceae bacterium KLH11]
MGKRLYRDIDIKGVTYPTVNDAAAHFGVQAETIRAAIRNGRIDTIGSGYRHRFPMRICIRGQVFPSAKAAAKHFNVTVGAIRQALSKDRLDAVGLPRKYNGAGAKPVTIGRLEFPSMAAASRMLGFSSGYISKATRRRSLSAMQRILGAAMRGEACQSKIGAQTQKTGAFGP